MKDIAAVAIDQGELLRKIITSDRKVKFGNGNLLIEGLAEVHHFCVYLSTRMEEELLTVGMYDKRKAT